LQKILSDDQVEEKMIASLHVCLQINVKNLIESDSECLKLFLLLGMLPGGVTKIELIHFV